LPCDDISDLADFVIVVASREIGSRSSGPAKLKLTTIATAPPSRGILSTVSATR
jgi:hypothetical protein